MSVGEKRKLTIQPALGYGSRSMGAAIPANSVLSKNECVSLEEYSTTDILPSLRDRARQHPGCGKE